MRHFYVFNLDKIFMLPYTNLTTVSINYNNKFAEHYKLICNKL